MIKMEMAIESVSFNLPLEFLEFSLFTVNQNGILCDESRAYFFDKRYVDSSLVLTGAWVELILKPDASCVIVRAHNILILVNNEADLAHGM